MQLRDGSDDRVTLAKINRDRPIVTQRVKIEQQTFLVAPDQPGAFRRDDDTLWQTSRSRLYTRAFTGEMPEFPAIGKDGTALLLIA